MSKVSDENRNPNRPALSGNIMGKKGKTIEEIYTKKTQLEHILLRPDTYVGSIEKQTQTMWVLDLATKQLVMRPCSYPPGLYKIFDEIVVNAADNKQRDMTMNKIEVTIDSANSLIRVWNNGAGIPVKIHKEHNIYVPELIFGHLLTGSNFDDEEQKTTGGRNGYGAKLANIFSSEFIVETSDSSSGLSFKQTFTNNMNDRTEPQVKKSTGSDFTCITFRPDLRRFKMDHFDEDLVALLSKRVYDLAGTNCSGNSKIAVYLNGERINVKSLESYIELFSGLEKPIAFARVNDRWEIGIGASDGSFQQVSYVNSICTIKGGQHVNYIAEQVVQRLAILIKKRNKGTEIKPNQIKNHLAIYVNALITNPAFDSQTKENLTSKSSSFGSTCDVPDKMLKEVEKSIIVEKILDWAKFKQNAELKKKGGSKMTRVMGITKLDDANFAGTAKSNNCTLILTEGDSAKALAISGLGVVGRDYYGVFPLKGKLLNVREASHAQIMKNEEIQNIAKILGLTFGKTYDSSSSLRYGHLMIMTDQDHDGSHIKGLLINFLHHFWPSLLQVSGFMQQFITPIVKCTKGKNTETFFTIPEYNTWKNTRLDLKSWKIKYYKGLGTSTSAEAKEYFSCLDVHEVDFAWGDERSGDQIDMAFSKKRVEDRKQWLLNLQPGCFMDYSAGSITYDEFVNRELILFSHADNERSIPHFMDGMKPSQRKVLFACFKRNLKQEIKVAQLAGYISEHSAYHHGEASLTQTIIGMAQSFVGSNNINLLSPCGQFGTRLMGGKDAASPRYVFTKLENITRCIFHPHDDPLLDYLDDDGQSIEPSFYVPVIPMILVNGADGIGTGWSSSVPTYNPRDIILNLRRMISGELAEHMIPWYRGFTGDIVAKSGKDSANYQVSGRVERIDDSTIVISELPVGKWTTDYKQMLESMIIGAAPPSKEDGAANAPTPQFIKSFKENHTDTTVLFTIVIPPEKLIEIEAEKGGLQKKLKLDGSVATSNMHMFDAIGQMKKFESVKEIMDAFFDVRLKFYDKRKEYLVKKLGDELDKLDNRVRFILAVVSGELIVSNRKKTELLLELKKKGYKTFVVTAIKKSSDPSDTSSNDEENDEDDNDLKEDLDKGYDYLLSMKIWSLTLEKVQALTAERNAKKVELDDLSSKTPEDLWLNDLDCLEIALEAFENSIEDSKVHEKAAQRKAFNASKLKSKSRPNQKAVKGRALGSDDEISDDDDESFSDFEERPKKKPIAVKKSQVVKSSSSSATTAKTSVLKPAADVEKVFVKPSAQSSASISSKMVQSKLAFKPKAKAESEADSEVEFVTTSAPVTDVIKPPARAAKANAKPIVIDSEEEDSEDYSGDDSFSDDYEVKPKNNAPMKSTSSKAAEIKSTSKSITMNAPAVSYENSEVMDFDKDESSDVASNITAPVRAVKTMAKPIVIDSEDDESAGESDASFSDDDKPKKKAPVRKQKSPTLKAKSVKARGEIKTAAPIINNSVKSVSMDFNKDDVDNSAAPVAKILKLPVRAVKTMAKPIVIDSEDDESAGDSDASFSDDDKPKKKAPVRKQKSPTLKAKSVKSKGEIKSLVPTIKPSAKKAKVNTDADDSVNSSEDESFKDDYQSKQVPPPMKKQRSLNKPVTMQSAVKDVESGVEIVERSQTVSQKPIRAAKANAKPIVLDSDGEESIAESVDESFSNENFKPQKKVAVKRQRSPPAKPLNLKNLTKKASSKATDGMDFGDDSDFEELKKKKRLLNSKSQPKVTVKKSSKSATVKSSSVFDYDSDSNDDM